jgi:hypothetical protein
MQQDKDWLLRMAVDSQKRADDIFNSIEPGNNQVSRLQMPIILYHLGIC